MRRRANGVSIYEVEPVDPSDLSAGAADSFSPAELQSLAQEPAPVAMTGSSADDPSAAVAQDDFFESVERHRPGREARALTH